MRQRGSVLILSLWGAAVLTILGITQAHRVALEVKWVGRLQESRQAWYLAHTAVQAAAARMLLDEAVGFDAPAEPWWRETPEEPISLASGSFRYEISDLQARIPLNAAGLDLLQALPGFDAQIAADLIARITDPDTPKPIAHLAELTTLGFSADDLEALAPLVTVHGAGPMNLNTVYPEVLDVLGISAAGVDLVDAYRKGSDGVLGTEDDRIFEETGTILTDMEAAGVILPAGDKTVLSELIQSQSIRVASSWFQIEAEGVSKRHTLRQRVRAVLNRESAQAPATIGGWHEG